MDGSSADFHEDPFLTRPAFSDLSRLTGGNVSASPSIFTTGLVPTAKGERPASKARCIAVTFVVVTVIVSPSIFAFTRARSHSCPMASTVIQNMLL